MSNPTISPSMTVQQTADLLEAHKARDTDVYVRIESYRGKPQAFLMREPRQNYAEIPAFLRQAE